MGAETFRYWRLPFKHPELTRRLVAHVARVYGGHPLMRRFVVLNVLRPAGIGARDDLAAARAICEWVRDRVQFVNEAGESVLTPARVLLWRYGDCDDRSGLVAAMCESIRLPWRLVLLARRVGERRVPFHIWPQARVGGRWYDLETSHPAGRFGEHPVAMMRRVSGLSL